MQPERLVDGQHRRDGESSHDVSDPADVERWQRKLGPHTGLRVGLIWGSGFNTFKGQNRSCPLAEFAPLAQVPGCEFYGLQKGPQATEEAPTGLVLHRLSDELESWLDTAAAMEAMDLIISVDTGPCHLACALGRPIWVLLRFACEWRWGMSGETTPWYSTARLFRQPKPWDWGSVMKRVANELQTLVEMRKAA